MHQNHKIHEVWKSFQAGDSEAFAYIYNLHLDSLYRYGTKLWRDEDLVKDAIQEVFLDLYMKKENNHKNPENLKFYLILSLKHNLIKKIKKIRKLVVDESNYELLFEPEYSIEKQIIKKEEHDELYLKIQDVLQQLPVKQKEALYLKFNESLEYNEVARLMNISVESVRKQVYRALKSVRESLKKETLVVLLFL